MPKLDPALLTRARQVDLIAYLHTHGHQPAYARRSKALFHSPLREDRHPSFSVFYKDGAWKWIDYGTGEHGDGIDLVIHLRGLDFQTAVNALLGQWQETPIDPALENPRRSYSRREIRRLHHGYQTAMTAEHHFCLQQYFLEREIAFPEGLGLVYLTLHVHGDGTRVPYVGIPVPSPQPHLMTGIECRAVEDQTIDKQYARRTLGDKTLWIVRRPASSILVTESILDCLAGNQLLQNRTSLCALNSVNNIDQLVPCMKQLRPGTIYLALDNDPDKAGSQPTHPKRSPPGPAAQQKATDALVHAGFRVVEVLHHREARVKDLHKLLRRDPSLITLESLEWRGIVHEPSRTVLA
ncbi:MAG: toprim domain-containing protein [Nitrospirota bacterium]|nr:toprim domain-containing protein [Nitrospirota bacterium]MDE3220885.1 toprim domain-containing protein [Nitrospirota bacterium]